jgi:hypothetical protein
MLSSTSTSLQLGAVNVDIVDIADFLVVLIQCCLALLPFSNFDICFGSFEGCNHFLFCRSYLQFSSLFLYFSVCDMLVFPVVVPAAIVTGYHLCLSLGLVHL